MLPSKGLKVVTGKGWFTTQPSGTEDVYRIYSDSSVGVDHLSNIQADAQAIVDVALK